MVRGEGLSPIVLLHGFLGSHRNLGALARGLAQGFTTYAFDLPGHGQSPALEVNSLESSARAVLDQIAELELATPTPTVGHSLGGRVALMARRLAPQSLAPLVLLDITPSPITRRAGNLRGVANALLAAPERAKSREVMRDHLARTLEPPIVEWLLLNLKRDAGGYTWVIDREALARFDQRASDEDLWDAVDDSVTCVRGAASPYVSNEDARRFEELGARVVTIEDAGHFVHVDATERVVAIVTECCAG